MVKTKAILSVLQKYLREARGFEKIPSRSSLYRILSQMPSASMREMRGVDTTQELAMRAFQKLHKILDKLRDTKNSISVEVYDNLKKCIDSSKMYLKTTFFRNLKQHSNIKSHCVGMACSDPNNDECKEYCFDDDLDEGIHPDFCPHCENIREMFRAFSGLVTSKQKDFEDGLDYVEALHEVNEANELIFEYQRHLVRTWIQQSRCSTD